MKNPKLSPEEYRKILEKIELKNLSLIESKSKIDHQYHAQKLELIINDKNTFETAEDELTVFCKYTFKAKGAEKEKPLVDIMVRFQLVYDLKGKADITQDFFEIYEEMSLGFIVWPYFREFIQNTLARMNLPPLTLPMRKIG